MYRKSPFMREYVGLAKRAKATRAHRTGREPALPTYDYAISLVITVRLLMLFGNIPMA